MSRITTCFTQLKGNNKTALIPYIAAGDPKPEITVPLMHALVNAGADILELGFPFSDPVADGPVIQKAHQRALKNGVTLSSVLDMVGEFRKTDSQTPIVLMGYANPIEIMGYQNFISHAKQAGIDGVIIVDLPFDEADQLFIGLKAADIAPIFLLAPTTSDQRYHAIINHAQGFLYYVSLKGVTGSQQMDTAQAQARIEVLRQQTDLPVAVGFGIRNAKSARAMASAADAVVIGSALINEMLQYEQDETKLLTHVGAWLTEIRKAIDE